MDGKFTLSNVPSSAKTLVVSFIGMASQEVSIKQNVSIILKSDTKVLGEVMVVAYGTAKKESFTGSASVINNKKLELRPISNVTKGLEGQTTGLLTTSGSGQPGEAAKIVIRGYGSINASQDPLYVVDGIPFSGDMSSINPADIESMTVLKDASAGALYGARGANGVIMITTKTGGKDSKNLSFNANYGFQMPGRLIETMSHDQFIDYINSAYMNSKGTTVYNDENPAPDTHTDWQRETLYGCKPVQDYSLSLDGTSGDTQYMLSGGIYLQDGLLPSSEFDKYTFRTNVQHKFNNFLKIGTHMQYSYTEANMAELSNYQGALNDIWRDGWPTLPVYREDGAFAVPQDNPRISTLFW